MKSLGLGWLKTDHINKSKKVKKMTTKLEKLFVHTSAKTLSSIMKKYKMDFEMCGYDIVWKHLTLILESKI